MTSIGSIWRKARKAQDGSAGTPGSTLEQRLRKLTVREAVVAVAILVLLVLPVVFVNHPVAYIPLVTYVFLLVLDFAYLKGVKHGLGIDYDARGDSCTRGTSVVLPVLLKNGSRLPILRACPQVYVENPYGELEHETLALVLLDARDEHSIDIRMKLGHIGVYAAGIRGVVLYGPLRFFHSFVRVLDDGRAELASLPQGIDRTSFELSVLAMRESMAPVRTVLSDDIDYAGTREYELGDPLKSIHWKLSARTGELQTRLFETSVNTRLSVIMDFHGPDYFAEDLMTCADAVVETALAVGRLGLDENMETRLCFVDREGTPVARDLPGGSEMGEFIRELPLLSAQTSARDAVGLVDREVGPSNGSDSVVVCTSSITRELVQSAASVAARHVHVSFVLAVPRGLIRSFYAEHRGLLGELSSAGIPCLVLSSASEIGKVSLR